MPGKYFDELEVGMKFKHSPGSGDTVYAESEIIEMRESQSRPNAGIVRMTALQKGNLTAKTRRPRRKV